MVGTPEMTALLAPDKSSPVRVLREDGRSDLFLTADHAGRAMPRSLGRLGLAESDLDRHIAWDIGIAAVTERLSAVLDATAVLQSYSRLVIDCNRDPGVPSSIPEISESTCIPGNLDLTSAQREMRRPECSNRITHAFAPCSMPAKLRSDARSMSRCTASRRCSKANHGPCRSACCTIAMRSLPM